MATEKLKKYPKSQNKSKKTEKRKKKKEREKKKKVGSSEFVKHIHMKTDAQYWVLFVTQTHCSHNLYVLSWYN